MSARRSAVGMFTAWYSMTTIQQLLKGKDSKYIYIYIYIYSYKKQPVLPDKQFTSQLLSAYNS